MTMIEEMVLMVEIRVCIFFIFPFFLVWNEISVFMLGTIQDIQ